MFEARCPACRRIEEWDGTRVTVRMEGGGRRPAEPAPIAAWNTITKAFDHGAIVLGPCPACGQPLVTEARGAPAGVYVIDLPGPDVMYDGSGWVGPNGPIGRDDALARIRAAVPVEKPDVGRLVFTSFAASMGGVGLVLWIAAGIFVAFFLIRGAQTGLLWGQRGTGIYVVEP